MGTIGNKYGWLPDLPDHRDIMFATSVAPTKLPGKIDLRSKCPDVYNQGNLGSCTANAIAAAIQFERKKQSLTPDFTPSRLFIYYNEREMEHTVDSDSGAHIRDGIKSVATLGACPEPEWQYNVQKFTIKPPQTCYKDALKDKAVKYLRLTHTLNQLKGCLSEGYPFVFGFTVYESFESPEVARTGILNMPSPEENVLGGHAVVCVGYDDTQNRFLVRNSWGADWGMKGYFTMPYSYLTDSNLVDDLWTIRLVS